MTVTTTKAKRGTGEVSKAAAAGPLSAEKLRKMHAYWRAANYLSVGQIYLMDNPLLKQPLKLEHAKPRLLGHWGTTPGLNFIYVHFNRLFNSFRFRAVSPAMSRPKRQTPSSKAMNWG